MPGNKVRVRIKVTPKPGGFVNVTPTPSPGANPWWKSWIKVLGLGFGVYIFFLFLINLPNQNQNFAFNQAPATSAPSAANVFETQEANYPSSVPVTEFSTPVPIPTQSAIQPGQEVWLLENTVIWGGKIEVSDGTIYTANDSRVGEIVILTGGGSWVWADNGGNYQQYPYLDTAKQAVETVIKPQMLKNGCLNGQPCSKVNVYIWKNPYH